MSVANKNLHVGCLALVLGLAQLVGAGCSSIGVLTSPDGGPDGGLRWADGRSDQLTADDGRSDQLAATEGGAADVSPACAASCSGCCDGEGCHAGDTGERCGEGGADCLDCTRTGQLCGAGGICEGPCQPDCAGRCAGASDGCGASCADNECAGCCDGELSCRAGTSHDACGPLGGVCDACADSEVCRDGGCKCVPDCDDACPGGDDGCGGFCQVSQCGGCCDKTLVCRAGDAVGACGDGGATCQLCAPGLSCVAGQCECVPTCDGKCAGQDDGCGGLCPANDCPGCCGADGTCHAGSDDADCGGAGGPCEDCTVTATPVCLAGTCVCLPACQDKCAGAADGCGGVCPTNRCHGCCATLDCLAGDTAAACGHNGAACVDCAGQGQVCSISGKCI